MQKNVGNIDRIFRAIVGVCLLIVGFMVGFVSPWNWVVSAAGSVFY